MHADQQDQPFTLHSVIRIPSHDVWREIVDWRPSATEAIDRVAVEGRVQNLYLGLNNEYAHYPIQPFVRTAENADIME